MGKNERMVGSQCVSTLGNYTQLHLNPLNPMTYTVPIEGIRGFQYVRSRGMVTIFKEGAKCVILHSLAHSAHNSGYIQGLEEAEGRRQKSNLHPA